MTIHEAIIARVNENGRVDAVSKIKATSKIKNILLSIGLIDLKKRNADSHTARFSHILSSDG